MKTTEDLNKLIDENALVISEMNHDYNNREFKSRELKARAYKELRKKIGKHNDEVRRLRRLLIFIEITPEEGIRMMRDRLKREIQATTATAHRLYDPKGVGENKKQIQEYLSNVCVPLKRKQLAELEFILK